MYIYIYILAVEGAASGAPPASIVVRVCLAFHKNI